MIYDVAIIGGGPAGYVAAIRAAQLGLTTCCIEKRNTLGGTCLNVGCIPSKTLLHGTELYHEASKGEFGIHGDIRLELSELMAKKESVVSGLCRGIDGLFKKNKVTRLEGTAKFITTTKLDVDGETVEAKNIIIATGSEPIELPFLPFDEKHIVSSTGALSLEKVPEKMIIVGAGVIGLELGSVYGRLGANVECVEFLDHICPTLDREVGKTFQKILEKQGMTFHLSHKVTGYKDGTLECEGGKTFDADVVLVSVGRRPYTDGLNLEGVGLAAGQGGFIPVDGHFRTLVPNIYAIGDCIDGPMLAHKGSEEGAACAEIIAGHSPHINYMTIPLVVYTTPEVASTGLTEEQAKNAGLDYNTGSFPFKANSRAHCTDQTEGLVKVIRHKPTDRLLGMHIVATHASEMIHEGVAAIDKEATCTELASFSHAHPTLSEAIKEAALDALGHRIHL